MAAHFAVKSMTLILRDADTGGAPLSLAVERLRERGIEVTAEVASERVGAVSLAEKAAANAGEAGTKAIVAAGGDGTLNEVVNGAFQPAREYEFGVGVVPLGTANDFARQCRIPPEDPQEALEIIARGRVAWIDLGRMNDRLFVNNAIGGFIAEISSETSSVLKKMIGPAAYLVQGLANVNGLSARHMKITAPEREWEGDALLLIVANGGMSGSMAKISEFTRINDGLLDVCVLPDMPFSQALSVGDHVRRGGALSLAQDVIYFQTPWLEVQSKALQVNLDGQPFSGDSLRFDTVERCVPFFMPLNHENPAFIR